MFKVSDNALHGSVSQDALAELKTLANIIQSSVEQIEAAVAANSFNFPSPDLPFSLESEAPRMHSAVRSAGSLITSAAAQLITLVRPAPLTLLDIMMQVKVPASRVRDDCSRDIMKFHVCTAMRTAVSTHVAEILRDAGPKVILYLSITLQLSPTFFYVGKTRQRNCQAVQGSQWKIRCVS